MLYKYNNEDLIRICATYVYDTLHAVNKEYIKEIELTEQKFHCKSRLWNNIKFTGLQIKQIDSIWAVHQKRYIDRLQKLKPHCDFFAFRSLRVQLAWASNSRPDVCFAVALLAQITIDTFLLNPQKYIKENNGIITHLQKNKNILLLFSKLKVQFLTQRVYSDASYATNDASTLQLE